jgi:HD superfamily phosphohydrolase
MSENQRFAPWIPADTKLDPFHRGISQFVGEHLKPFDPQASSEIFATSKSIADPLIGYVHLRPWEVAFIDTNLFQRLRRVRQVGLAYLVYPTLCYSRFEHTLGVLGNITKLSDRIKQIYGSKEKRDVQILETLDDFEIPLRLAALFHDIGHCIFSHVAERAMRNLPGHQAYPSTKYLVSVYSKALGSGKLLAPAEMLSVAIISSPEIRQFVSRLTIPEKTDVKINFWLEAAARFIAGNPMPMKPNTVFLSQLLSSGLDADKLDYMQRDARLTAIPLGIDMVRIHDKLRVHRLNASELPSGLAHLKASMPSDQPFLVLGLTHGGQFAFEEFCIARASLYDKIYLHQKVRAAEVQLYHLLARLPGLSAHFTECHWWLYLSENMVDHEDLPLPGVYRSDELFKIVPTSELGLKPIHLRKILKRAFAIGLRNSLSEPGLELSSEATSPTWKFIIELKDNCAGFLTKLQDEIRKVARMANRNVSEEEIAKVAIDVPEHTRVQQGATNIYIKQPVTLPHRWALPIDQVAEYYRRRALSYIFAPAELCALVAVAAEKIIYATYGLEFEQREFLSDQIEQEIRVLKDTFSNGDYYFTTPALKPKSNFLLTAAAQEKIATVVSNLSEFKSHTGQHVTPSRTSAFLMQFPTELQPTALEMLMLVRLIEPIGLITELCNSYKRIRAAGNTNILISPLGNLTDSAAHLPYYLKNSALLAEDIPTVALITDNNLVGVKHLVLFDDNINSGLQTLNIMAEWLGVVLPKDSKLNESHVAPLNDESKAALKNAHLHFVFGVGPATADTTLKQLLVSNLGMNPNLIEIKICEPLDETHKIFSGRNSKLKGERVELREFIQSVGTSIIKVGSMTEEMAKQRALGDSGSEALIIFPYNVPSMTVTALWCVGNFEGKVWMPLCERRRHRNPKGEITNECS